MSETRISAGAATLGLTVDEPAPDSDLFVAEVFTTHRGSWEVDHGDPFSVPQWARDAHLKPWGDPDYFDDAGGDHHIFSRVENENKHAYDCEIWHDSDGDWAVPTVRFTGEKQSGWANLPIYGCCWNWGPPGGPYVQGAGANGSVGQHISVFAVWRSRDPIDEPPPDLPTDDFERAMAWIFEREGGYSLDPEDHGNWTGGKKGVGELVGTKYGISGATWGKMYDIANLTKEQAQAIYKEHYWLASQAYKYPWPLSLLVFDTAVLHGPGAAAKWLRESGADPYQFAANRLKVYTNMDNWHFFGAGWVNRMADLLTVIAEAE